MASQFEGELTAYRIVREGVPPLDGAGAYRWGGRWTSPGRYVVHAAETYALAVLESLVHFNRGELPPRLVVAQLRIPAQVSRDVLLQDRVPGWTAAQPNAACRSFGDSWYDGRRSAVLVAPSVLSPFECNLLINQAHSESGAIAVIQATHAVLDDHLLQFLRGA
ncbi:MAG: RES domain-containing protein [Gammaproteobacteria bacterium]|nr:RES domain-containing protein [Gammaproteobacteria bacterium]